MIEAVSSYAQDIDNLILLIAGFVGFWFVVAEMVLVTFIVKFRHKEGTPAQYISGEEKQHKKWINIPHILVLICDVFIVVGAIRVWVDVKQNLPEPDQVVRITAQQWAWTFQHPGADGELDTADDIETIDELHIKQGAVYHYKLESKDVLHDFSVPVFRLKQDAVPGRVITGWFKAISTGSYDIQCAEMCGIGHGLMPARIIIETPEQHTAWIQSNSNAVVATKTAAADG